MKSKILVIDDSTDLLEIFSMILIMHGFDVATTDKADNIDELLNTFVPDLLLLDVRLRDNNGMDLCKRINEKYNRHPPVILISASPELLKNYKEYLAFDVIEKPFDIKTVTEKINAALGQSQFGEIV